MKKCLIIGKANVGKTLFLIHFANYLGIETLHIKHSVLDDTMQRKLYTLKDAVESLVSHTPFKTKGLQSIELELPTLKGHIKLEYIDSSGLIDGIHGDRIIRRGIVKTLDAIRQSDIILHVIDITSYGLRHADVISSFGKTDLQLTQYGISHQGYAILANKIDLLENKSKLAHLQGDYPHHTVIPVSALTSQGFNEVKAYCCYKSK